MSKNTETKSVEVVDVKSNEVPKTKKVVKKSALFAAKIALNKKRTDYIGSLSGLRDYVNDNTEGNKAAKNWLTELNSAYSTNFGMSSFAPKRVLEVCPEAYKTVKGVKRAKFSLWFVMGFIKVAAEKQENEVKAAKTAAEKAAKTTEAVKAAKKAA